MKRIKHINLYNHESTDWKQFELFIRLHVHLAFQVQDQDQAQVSKWKIFGLVPVICSTKLDFCIH